MHSLTITRNFLIIIVILLIIDCSDEITLPPVTIITPTDTTTTKVLKGTVILENQIEHCNALVYLDSLHRGVSTDSSGNYSLSFSEEDTIHSGVFKIYFFVNEFEMDSAQYVLKNGKVKLDTLDVDRNGILQTKELKQLLLIEGWTDKQEYRIGETIVFTARFTNVSDKAVHVFIYSCWGPFGYVSLYNENYHSFNLSPCDPVTADCDIDIYPQDFFEGTSVYTIPDGYYCGTPIPLPMDEFIVAADLFIEGRLRSPYDKLELFIFSEWYNFHKGNSPRLDWYPNKYDYPIISIIE